jgi:GrpB-like predicted nucleotidyltransferase (UPF0157 family)
MATEDPVSIAARQRVVHRLPTAMSLGLESGAVRLVPPDPTWPAMFAAEAQRIHAALGPDLPLTLEHIGSTSVPALAAKPILDIIGGYPPGAELDRYVAALVRGGYVHRGERGIPGREFFRRGDPRAYHLHVVVKGGALWRAHLAFRDTLRTQPAVREAYAALKQELARLYPRDREAYIDGKAAFIRRVVADALDQDQPPV